MIDMEFPSSFGSDWSVEYGESKSESSILYRSLAVGQTQYVLEIKDHAMDSVSFKRM